jgi:uncharacterized protein with gpF-like domain
MLLNVAHDSAFQRFLDGQEQRLHVKLVPILSAGFRLAVTHGPVPGAHYINTRGEPVLLRHYRRIYEDAFNATVDQIEKAATTGRGAFMAEHLSYLEREAAQKIADISQRSTNRIRKILMAGVAEGKPTNQIAREIAEQIPRMTREHAATIARTETHSAAVAAVYETAQFKRVPVKTKTWWSVGDKLVRPTHVEAHGLTIPFDQPFEVGGYLMMYPGDSSMGAGAEEITNCRCSPLFRT